MTDKEITQASKLIDKLRDAYNDYYDTSKGMPYDIDTTLRESAICLENALNEINRQQSAIDVYMQENDRLKTAYIQVSMDRDEAKAEIERLDKAIDNYENCLESVEKIKFKAIKKFAKRLIEVSHPYGDTQMVFELQIDNLLKEMVGDDNG